MTADELIKALTCALQDADGEHEQEWVRALLPVVRGYAAEQLRKTGEDFRRTTLPGPWSSAEVAYEMDARADALEGPA